MQTWKFLAAAALIVVLLPTVRLMHQIERTENEEEKRGRQRRLKLCMGMLVVIFLAVLGATLYGHYAALLAAQ